MTKMTIEIPENEYKKVKIAAIELGVSIKDYVLDSLRLKQKILVGEDGIVRILNNETVLALEESRKGKLKSFKNIDDLMKNLNSK